MLDYILQYINNNIFIWNITGYGILILFISLGFSFLLIKKELYIFLKKYIGKKDLLILFFLFIFSLGVRIYFLDNSHITMNDEYMYIQHSRELIETGKILSPIRSVGWSFLLVCPFSLFGISSYVGFYFAIFIGSLTIIIFYLLLKIVFKNKIIAFYSSLLFSILPFHVFWSTKMETSLPSLLFIMITILFFVIYQKTKNIKIFYFTILLTLFSTTFRGENIPILLLYLFLLTLINYKQIYGNKKNLFISLVIFIFGLITVLPNYLNQYNFSTSQDWTYGEGNNFGFSNFISNIDYFINGFLNNHLYIYYNYIVILGLLFLFYNLFFGIFKKIKKEFSLLIIPFILLFFSYNFIWLKYVAQENRLYMEIYPLYIIFFGLGIYLIFFLLNKIIKNIIIRYIIILLLFLLVVYNLNSTYGYYKKSDYRLLQTIVSNNFKNDIYLKNKKCIYILFQNTYYTAFEDIPYTFIYEFLYNKKLQTKILNNFSCIIYVKDKSSIKKQFLGDIVINKSTIEMNDDLINKFKIVNLKKYNINDIEYGFYKLIKNKGIKIK